MSLFFSDFVRNARANAIVAQLDRAATPGTLELYYTTQPAAGAAPGGSPATIITLQKPCGTVSAGVISFTTTQPAQLLTGGTVLWARARDGDGYWMLDGNVAVTGTPGAAFTLPDVVMYAGAFVFLFNATLTEP
ncbi:hypothetical protein [Candidatus Accumulibacter contiguus]|jgi:hypothetical protein|uniref:hypothetical protein n=1 Tax=Candidatus Accumulibacter contiguus TaxID=2954381 RepID=UPI002FC37918